MTTEAVDRDADARFFLKMAIAIAVTIILAFSLQFAMGRSTFAQPAVYHLHGLVYMGWVAIFVAQHWLAAKERITRHRQLGRLALVWIALMVIFGMAITVTVIQRGTTPFFFLPQHFLVANPLTLLAFVGLVAAAVRMRARTDWHQRLQLCAMAMILGPAFGRLLPAPLMTPVAFEVSTGLGMIFPLVAAVRDWRMGAVHPAWAWGIAVMALTLLLGTLIGYSALAGALYDWVAQGTPGAAVDPLAFGTPPLGM